MEETLKLVQKLDASIAEKDEARIKVYLSKLKGSSMTLKILMDTGIGVNINKMRKNVDNNEISAMAKSLIKSWKKLVPDSNGPTTTSKRKSDTVSTANSASRKGSTLSSSQTSSIDKKKQRLEHDSDNDDDQESSPHDADSSNKDTTHTEVDEVSLTSSGFPLPKRSTITKDPVRLKCREMIHQALVSEALPLEAFDPEYIADEIETAIFNVFNNTDMKYKNRVRSRVLNLRDKKNPELRNDILLGILKPLQLATMTAEEMASVDMKKQREEYAKQAINDRQMSTTGCGTTTDLLRCGKCRKNNCTYNQVQTRSSDEPMTTFVLCNECGHRWKFC